MNHHQCDIHMHPAAYVHGPVLITYLRDILAVGFWLGDLAASTPRSVDHCWFFHGLRGLPSRPPRQPLPPITQGRTLLPRNPRGRRPDALPKSAR